MIYLVLYDEFGNCQRVATADNESDANRFIEAGFVEVEQAEYERCAAIAETTFLSDLRDLAGAIALLALINNATRNAPQPVPSPIDRNKLEALIDQFTRNSQKRTSDLFAGTIDSQQWYDATARQILRNRLAARAAGAGGFDKLTSDDLTAARNAARRELTYLAEFRKKIDAGTISEKQALARIAQYGGGARQQAEEAQQAASGLPALPAQPGVRTQCRRNCKCSWDIRKLDGNGNFDCYWRRSPVDSCDTCRRREDAFNPLQIRNSVIQPFSTAGIYA